MNIESHNMGAYNLHFIKTNKFKTISVDVNFYREIKEDEITKRNLLKMILLDSNNDYKTERELIIESERLYDIKISSGISRIGKFSDLSFQTKFLNEKYTEEDMNKESIIFFLSLIFNPCVKEGRFVNIDKQKNRLYQEINSLKDNKIKYSMLKLMEKIKDKPYSYNPYGKKEDLDDMSGSRIKVTLYNRTFKEIDMSDFTRITEGIFSNRDDIVEVAFPEGVEVIAPNAFENCRRLEKVEFPKSLKSIENEAFINCLSLKEADYGKNVTVAPDAFKGCINL